MAHERFGQLAPALGIIGGILGTLSFAAVIAGEVTLGSDFASSPGAAAAGWISFAGSVAVVTALIGLFVISGKVKATGAYAFLVALVGGVVSVAANATIALVVPTLAQRLPDLIANPPAAVPATTILGGLTMAVGGVWLAVALRRSGLLSAGARTFLIAAFVVAGAPLPSRYFLLGFALALAAHQALRTGDGAEPLEELAGLSDAAVVSPVRPLG